MESEIHPRADFAFTSYKKHYYKREKDVKRGL